jgi:hypothetical protein
VALITLKFLFTFLLKLPLIFPSIKTVLLTLFSNELFEKLLYVMESIWSFVLESWHLHKTQIRMRLQVTDELSSSHTQATDHGPHLHHCNRTFCCKDVKYESLFSATLKSSYLPITKSLSGTYSSGLCFCTLRTAPWLESSLFFHKNILCFCLRTSIFSLSVFGWLQVFLNFNFIDLFHPVVLTLFLKMGEFIINKFIMYSHRQKAMPTYFSAIRPSLHRESQKTKI